MKTAIIRSSWMTGYGYRMDCQPYLGGALETKILLEKLPLRKDKLHTLTAGFDGGIYNGPKFPRTYVESPEFGVPFVGGSSMLQADLSDLPLLSKKQAASRLLRHLELKPGMSLISCSGTIGKMVYARHDMTGMWSSQHIMKVVPDVSKIPPGYLFAYLSSAFGIPLIVSGTYGSIIQSIGPEHIWDLPVLRLGDALEHEIHDLVENASRWRTKASEQFHEAVAELEQRAGLPSSAEIRHMANAAVVVIKNTELQGRLDTNFHRSYHYNALQPYFSKKVKGRTVDSIANSIVEPIRFKRIEHNDIENGLRFFGAGNLGDIDPQPLYRIAPFREADDYRVDEHSVLIPRSGQIYGIIGRALLPIGLVLSSIVTEDAIRVTCESPETAGFVFLALRSECGLRQVKSRCFGGSIPHLDVNHIGRVLIPDMGTKDIQRLGEMACAVSKLRSDAINSEGKAREMVEKAIKGAGHN